MKRIWATLIIALLLSVSVVKLLYKDRIDIIGFIKRHFQTETQNDPTIENGPVRVINQRVFENYVHNEQAPLWRAQPDKNRWLNLLFEIGGQNDEEFTFRNVIDMVFDSEGNLLVLDFGNKSIEVFAPKGNYLRTVGILENRDRIMLQPTDLSVDERERIYVSDRSKGILVFHNDGSLIKALSVPYKIDQIVLDTDANIMALTPAHKFLLHKFDSEGREVLVFAPQDEENPVLRSVFAQGHLAIDMDDNIYLSFVTPYQLFKYNSEGYPILKFKREFDAPINPPTVEKGKDGSIKYVLRQEISYDLQIGPDGLVYNLVRTKGNKGGNILDVFSRNGEYLQSFYLEFSAMSFALFQDCLALSSASKSQKIAVYRIMKVASDSPEIP